MDKNTKYEILRKSHLTDSMTDDECRVLATIPTSRTLVNDEELISEGHVDNSLHVIAEGMLAVTKEAGGGDWVTLHILRAGDLAGELGFIDGRPHSATLRSIGEATIFSFERAQFEGILETNPWVVYRMMQSIVQAIHEILRRMNNQHVEMTNYITKQHGRY